MDYENLHKYDDIIHLPHPVSSTHPQMAVQDRAAQFAPFAALTGHGEAVKEAERLTVERMELEEDGKELLNAKLQLIRERITDRPEVTITYFVPDQRKAGGSYVTLTEAVRKLDEYGHGVIMMNGERIAMEDIWEIEGI